MPAKDARGRLSSNADHARGVDPFGIGSGLKNLENSTRHRLFGPGASAGLRVAGVRQARVRLFARQRELRRRMPQRGRVSSRPTAELRTIGSA
jgi:hypothetical protein